MNKYTKSTFQSNSPKKKSLESKLAILIIGLGLVALFVANHIGVAYKIANA